VADLPFHYYLSLRGDLIRETTSEARAIAKASGDDDTIEFDADDARAGKIDLGVANQSAESFKGGMA
jgi:hypothetical protein